MRIFKSLICSLAITSLLTSPAISAPVAKRKSVVTKAVKKPVPPQPVTATPALWVVKDEDTTLYLFGTIHILKPHIKWFHGKVKQAFDGSQELIVEMIEPSDEKSAPILMGKAIDPDGPPLTQKLSPDFLPKYKKAMADIGIPYLQFEKFEPWFVSLPLAIVPLVKNGYDPSSGVETVLEKAATAQKKAKGQLETFEEQMDFFDKMPEADQINFLVSTVEEGNTSGPELDKAVANWAKGDIVAFEAYMNEGLSKHPNLRKRLLADRNANWVDWIQKRLEKPGTVFIAVGAGHLAGADSVQTLLQGKGLESIRLQ